jgi:hypothetical protein
VPIASFQKSLTGLRILTLLPTTAELLALLLIVSINGPFDDLCLTNLVVKEGKR